MTLIWRVLAGAAVALGFTAQMARWLRVLQREHYEPASMFRFWRRWTWSARRFLVSLSSLLWCTFPVALIVALVTHSIATFVIDSVLYGVACPWHLGLQGRTGALRWTRRLATVAVASLITALIFVFIGWLVHATLLLAALMVWLVPFVLALVARALEPYEARRANEFVERASQRLARVHPRVVAITGSYGKTSTKNHLADLLRHDGGVVATPKSFNNRAGLSRAINEQLTDDTRVFVAEMGTYGPGEIRALCAWCPPEVAVVTAIGPVHLERMKSLDVIEAAKFEVTERAAVVVVNVDDPRLATWPARLAPRRVRTAGSASMDADVRVALVGELWHVWVDGDDVAQMTPVTGVQSTNVACAVAAALEVGALASELSRRLDNVRAVANRATVATANSGVVVVDDTFNANPASARASLGVLTDLAIAGRRIVVTPGLIELGSQQPELNEALGRDVAHVGAELVIVGRTNDRSLSAGFGPSARRCGVRDEAVAWVRESLVAGDAVLYLNDLPDHYP
ncbi:MAG TPA: UDP-N-acetylmuramoyl-tripeptide--D-alanyl-D-alanine ligase [Acidimicrobiales bacterium]